MTLHEVGSPSGNPEQSLSLTDRTSELRKKGFEGRRLGPKQMTTDTAVRVTRMVVKDKSESLGKPGRCLLTLNSSVGQDPIPRPSRVEVG